VNDFNPFRGNQFYKNVYNSDGTLADKDSLGNLIKEPIDSTDLAGDFNRRYTGSDARDIGDGDTTSGYTYDYGNTTLINNDSRVIKGGSWADRAYWLSPGTRRFMQASHSSATVGFRCVMDRLGSPNFEKPGGNYFSKKRR
jgi:hypothetical protein